MNKQVIPPEGNPYKKTKEEHRKAHYDRRRMTRAQGVSEVPEAVRTRAKVAIPESGDSVARLTRDLAKAAKDLSEQEVRFLVDAYYISQDTRIRCQNQIRAMMREPHEVISFFAAQSEKLEAQIKRALDSYSAAHPVGRWLVSNFGIGPVIAAGLLAHIDIEKAFTAGHIWRFAGLDPTVKWAAKTKRPWNAQLKTLCWKAGQSFMKFHKDEGCVYGHVYKARKDFEQQRNDAMGNAERAAQILTEKNFNKSTEAYKALITGKLPPAQIDARARRYAVKLFLSHLQYVWWFQHFGNLPELPYPLGHMGHVHFVPIPNVEEVPGLEDALRRKGLQ